MNLHSKKQQFCKKLSSSLFYALRGIKVAFLTQRNMKIHTCVAIIVLLLSYHFKLNKVDLLFIILSIFLVFITETINSAIEKNIDLYTNEIDRNAMLGKDMAAGAVLITCIQAIIIGFVIFIPQVLDLISKS